MYMTLNSQLQVLLLVYFLRKQNNVTLTDIAYTKEQTAYI